MVNEHSEFEQRKRDHIKLALMPDNQSDELNTFDNYTLLHEALPDLNFGDISIFSTRFNQTIQKPFIVSSMTAGHQDALQINRHLVEACTQSQWAMGVGSQRRELFDENAAKEWVALRKDFPNVSLYSNLGIAQLITTPIDKIVRLVESLQSDALIIHCNPLQECIQPEGTPEFKGSFDALAKLTKSFALPIIVKETGCGFSKKTLLQLNDIGVSAVDISGLGGTHWGRIEGHRAISDPIRQQAAITFRNWGIDTCQSVLQAKSINPHFEIWGSGGVRNGLDAAKLFALGASTVGFAKPMLESAIQGPHEVLNKMNQIEYELKTAMFCTGSLRLSDLKEHICL